LCCPLHYFFPTIAMQFMMTNYICAVNTFHLVRNDKRSLQLAVTWKLLSMIQGVFLLLVYYWCSYYVSNWHEIVPTSQATTGCSGVPDNSNVKSSC
jgi:hypothetical protein